MTPLDRLLRRLRHEGECWTWTGGHKKAGYGQFSVDGRKVSTHRFAYLTFVGPIPDGYEVDHLCRNRACANPAHLEAVPLAVNRQRRDAAKTHCINGHLYTEANTARQASGRYCRTCNRERHRRRSAAREA